MNPSTPSKSSPVLRLVNSAPGSVAAVPQRAVANAYRLTPASAPAGRTASPATGPTGWADVTRENLSAAGFATGVGTTDPRWLLAVKTSSLIEGGNAGLLTPSRRREVMQLATQMRLRTFDANLVIAIVQDAARAGEGALSAGVRSRLTLVGATGSPESTSSDAASLKRRIPGLLAAACVLAGVMVYLLITWVMGS